MATFSYNFVHSAIVCFTCVGTCESLAGGDFVCHCKGSLKGKRCERASVCEEGLCKNGGSCQAGVSGVVCDCQPGYEGIYTTGVGNLYSW